MKTVYKYPLQLKDGAQKIGLPRGFRIVHVGVQKPSEDVHIPAQIMVWAEVDPKSEYFDDTEFYIKGTGCPIEANLTHHGTVIIDPFVWHVYTKWIYTYKN